MLGTVREIKNCDMANIFREVTISWEGLNINIETIRDSRYCTLSIIRWTSKRKVKRLAILSQPCSYDMRETHAMAQRSIGSWAELGKAELEMLWRTRVQKAHRVQSEIKLFELQVFFFPFSISFSFLPFFSNTSLTVSGYWRTWKRGSALFLRKVVSHTLEP